MTRTARRMGALAAALVAAGAFAACGSESVDDPPPPQSGVVSGATLEPVADGFAAPLLVLGAPDGERVLVAWHEPAGVLLPRDRAVGA